ncbi:MAG: methyltransferase domain-containing protein [Deltaproteobacteria bacterium]|nr:methyltransferase domain-containing protein [Deltaproteobacteria bacterium]
MIKKKNKKYGSSVTPGTFFRNIGIKLQGNGDTNIRNAENGVRMLGDKQLLEAYHRLMKNPNKQPPEVLHFMHSNLKLAKLLYGAGFYSLCEIAEELEAIPLLPQGKILDVGGGAGHLAFWLANIWPESYITVADRFSHLGKEWAEEIGEKKIDFVDTLLPDLALLEGEQFDFVIASRVLSNALADVLPRSTQALSIEEYLSQPEIQKVISSLEEMIKGLKRILKREGIVIVVEWRFPTGIPMLAEAFRRQGFAVDLNLLPQKETSPQISTVVFSRSANSPYISDPPMALSNLVGFGEVKTFEHNAAESLLKVFRGVEPTVVLEHKNGEELEVDEILERHGLMLFYTTSSAGYRKAVLTPATEIPRYIEFLESEISGKTVIRKMFRKNGGSP